MYKSIDQASDTLRSKVISFLRFPLIVAVTYIHCEPNALANDKLTGGWELLYIYIREILAGAAVPLFFAISGYLFFHKGIFSSSVYASKLKKRVRTLLVPYVIWNLLYWGILVIKSKFMPGDTADGALTHLSPVEFMRMFWNLRSGFYPMCAQFWFLRDLMVVMVLSPIIYAGVKWLRLAFVGIFGVLWVANLWWDITGLSVSAIFFFSAGAYMAIYKVNFVSLSSRVFLIFLCLYLLLLSSALCCVGYPAYMPLKALTILAEMIGVVGIVSWCIRRGRWHVDNFLSESSFFIYAYHQIVLAVLVKVMVTSLAPMNDMKLILIFLTAPVVIIGIGLGLYWLMRKTMPSVTKVLTGGR